MTSIVAWGQEAEKIETSKPDFQIEKPTKDLAQAEQQLTVGTAFEKVRELQAQVDELKKKAANLSETLATANTESAEQKEDYARMRLQMEALGVAALDGNERALQTRLLDAVNDYRLAEKSKKELTEKLVQLSEAAIGYMKSSDAASKERLEQTLGAAKLALREAAPQDEISATPLGTAKVVSFKPDLGLAVVNAGKASGLRLGMPVNFLRKDRSVANGVIVDCRDQITGVLITTSESGSDKVVIGDVLQIQPTNPARK